MALAVIRCVVAPVKVHARPCCFSDNQVVINSSYKCVSTCFKMKCEDTGSQLSGRFARGFLKAAVQEKELKPCQGFRVDGENCEEGSTEGSESDAENGDPLIGESRPKRPFCGVCRKPASLCICGRIKCVVKNQVGVTILQHPDERDHALGSARIAILSLANVQVITVPEVDEHVSYRIRPKVPGSKRSIAGRGGRKLQGNQDVQRKRPGQSRVSAFLVPKHSEVSTGSLDEDSDKVQENGTDGTTWQTVPAWINLQEGTGLLYPSDNAVELVARSGSFQPSSIAQGFGQAQMTSHRTINHLIVLDGTWAKARRMYCENPWLQALPHFRLSTTAPSLSQDVRRQPKPGCVSTVESIVFALKVLEPETQGLEGLLDVFNSMIDDQKRFKEERTDSRRGLS